MTKYPDVRRLLAGTTSLSACLLLAAAAAAVEPREGHFDLSGEAWLLAREQEEAEAREHAVTLRVAHDRVKGWLAAQPDDGLVQDLVDHLELTGTLPAAADPHSPFTADERDRFDGIGIEIRICGDRLVSVLVPDAEGFIGRLGGPYVRAQGRLAVTTATGIQPWNGDHVSSPDLISCGLPVGIPATYGSWRAPALERRERIHAESRVLDCPAGEVGPGIGQRRVVQTYQDGFGTDVSAETVIGPWAEEYRDCRTPRTGEITMPVECTIAGGHRAGQAGTRILSFSWTEDRVPGDPRSVRKVVDWASPTVLQDFCAGAAAEEVDVTTIRDLVTQVTACAVFHGTSWNLGGPVGEERDRYTSDIVFPASWGRPDEQVVALDPWRVTRDDCRRQVARSASGETRIGNCPSGYTGAGRYQLWRETWTWVEFADPVPYRSDYELPGSRTRTNIAIDSRCSVIGSTPPSNNDPDDDQQYWQDSQTGIIYSSRPPGSSPTDGHYCNCGGYPQNPGNWNNGDNDDNNDDNADDDDNGGGCFLTTAVASRRGEADDGPTLTALRTFRDGWLRRHPDGQELIAEYYWIAPRIVAAIPPGHDEWDRIAAEVDQSAAAILTGKPEEAFAVYRTMVRRLEAVWLAARTQGG